MIFQMRMGIFFQSQQLVFIAWNQFLKQKENLFDKVRNPILNSKAFDIYNKEKYQAKAFTNSFKLIHNTHPHQYLPGFEDDLIMKHLTVSLTERMLYLR